MELQNILCPIDFSDNSKEALRYAAAVSLKYQSVLHVLYSCHIPTNIPDTIGLGVPTELPSEFMYDNETLYKEKLEKLIHEVFAEELSTVTYHIIVRYGFAADTIEEVATDIKADLIVMYTSGADNFLDHMVGTVTGHVLKNVACPILILPHDYSFKGQINQIIYSTDLLSEADQAVEMVVSLARKFEAHISFLSIEKNNVAQSRNLVPYALNELLAKTAYKNISFHIQESDEVIEGLQSFAERKQADLLVMTTHTRSFFKKMLEKSKTREMVFKSIIPVLAFHK